MSNARAAQRFVDGLEQIDAELRERMARLDMGDIGDLSGTRTTAVGCGLCFEPYDTEDRPEWLVGEQEAKRNQAVGIPCPGHHVVHASCLREWFATVPWTDWTCPFCRASIDCHSFHTALSTSAKVAAGASGRSVREEVRHREREQWWRCDAPACLPRYPDDDNASRLSSALDNHPDQDMVPLDPPDHSALSKLHMLTPCHHKVHLECLMTTLRIVDDLPQSSIDEGVEGFEPTHHSMPYRLASVPPTNTFDSPPTRVRSGQRCGSGRLCCGGGRRRTKCAGHRSHQRSSDHGTRLWNRDSSRCRGQGPGCECFVFKGPIKLIQLLAHLICIRDDTDDGNEVPHYSRSKSYAAKCSSEREALTTSSSSLPPSPTTDAAPLHVPPTIPKTESNNLTSPVFSNARERDPAGKAQPPTSKVPASMFVRTSEGHLRTVGRWIKCPACCKEVWARMPLLQQASE